MTEHSPSSNLLSILKISLILMVGLSSCAPREPQIQSTATSNPQSTQANINKTQTEEPSITQTAAPCVETKGTIIDKEVPSKLLTESIRVKVYLPPCYAYKSDVKYSVLYMLHGQTSLDDQWVRIGLLAEMDELLEQKKVNPFVIVLPNEIRSNTDSFKSKYGDAIVEEVIPYINQQFNVCAERECRAIGGLSRGGNWAVHLGFSNPEFFTAVGAHSAPLFYGEITNILSINSTPESIAALPVFYIDVGNKDEDHADVMLFLDTLQNLNIPRQFNNNIGYHDETYWHAHVQDYLLWYDSQLKPPSEVR